MDDNMYLQKAQEWQKSITKLEKELRDIDHIFCDGRLSGEHDFGKPQMTLCPYKNDPVRQNWWYRGYSYASRLLRAFTAEAKIEKLSCRIAELEAEHASLIALVQKGRDLLQTAHNILLHADLHNGVTDPTGTMDEGVVVANIWIEQHLQPYLAHPIPKSIQTVAERLKKMEETLQQFADKGNWFTSTNTPFCRTRWVGSNETGYDFARAALAEAKEQEKP